jgi:signal transduction histidine kinase
MSQGEQARVAALCRLALSLRLLSLIVTAVYIATKPEAAKILSPVLLLAVLASYLPARYWERVGPVLQRHPSLLSADLALSLLILLLTGPDSPFFFYTLGTVAVAGIFYGRFGAAFFTVLTLAGYAAIVVARNQAGDQIGGFQELVGLPALYPLAAAGGVALRRLLTRQAEMEAELAEATRATAASEERARLARGMHDSLAKTLQGISLSASAVAIQAGRGDSRAEESATAVARAAEQAAGEARELIGQLRHESIVAPLGTAISERVADWSERAGIAASVECNGLDLPSPHARYELVEIVQEALRNVEHHAAASTVRVELFPRDGELVLEISDDGVGFTPAADLSSLAREHHFGIVGMTERAREIGGRLWVDASPGSGTKVTAIVPLPRDRDSAARAIAGSRA